MFSAPAWFYRLAMMLPAAEAKRKPGNANPYDVRASDNSGEPSADRTHQLGFPRLKPAAGDKGRQPAHPAIRGAQDRRNACCRRSIQKLTKPSQYLLFNGIKAEADIPADKLMALSSETYGEIDKCCERLRRMGCRSLIQLRRAKALNMGYQ